MKQLVILSGKGGTGKTSITAAFAHLAANGPLAGKVILADADVDAANLELVLQPRLLVDVTTIDDLAKLAERQNAMILHMMRDYLHYYHVQCNGTTYRYVISAGHNRLPQTEVSHTTNLGAATIRSK